jgi:hypothetical protein
MFGCLTLSSLDADVHEVSNTVLTRQELTPIFEKFRRKLEAVNATGDTAVYDALDRARLMLTQYRADLRNLRKRIIIVSDGDDTASQNTPQDICLRLRRDNIIVDSIQVGEEHSSSLHAISVITGACSALTLCSILRHTFSGGYRFFPNTSLGDALSIFVGSTLT